MALLPIAIAAALYAVGLWRVRYRPAPPSRAWAFYAGLATLLVAVTSAIDSYQERLLSVHMVQHILLAFAAAPLLILGAPITLALRAAPVPFRRRVVAPLARGPVSYLTLPAVAWVAFAASQYLTHFTPLYDAALESEGIHAFEHVVFLVGGVLFFWPLIARGPTRRRLSYPGRMLYVVLAMPVHGIAAAIILLADHPLYAHYAALPPPWGLRALTDQRLAGGIMLISGQVMTAFVAFFLVRAAARGSSRVASGGHSLSP